MIFSFFDRDGTIGANDGAECAACASVGIRFSRYITLAVEVLA